MEGIIRLRLILTFAVGCGQSASTETKINSDDMMKKLDPKLPTIGILVFEGFLASEILAPVDVFTKANADGMALFNVVTIAKEDKLYRSEEGLSIQPDLRLSEVSKLQVLVIPSSFRPDQQVEDSVLIDFIRIHGAEVDYIASHCAGAFMLGESGVAKGRKVVTYVGGGKSLQADYPDMRVQDDQKVDYVLDGKILSSNGSLVSYPASLELLEILTDKDHRQFVEEQLLWNKLKLN